MRVVNYIADALGYRASISTNEPGTDVKQDPAAVDLNYVGHGYAAPAVVSAPLYATKSYSVAAPRYSYPAYSFTTRRTYVPTVIVRPAVAGHGINNLYNTNKLY